MATRPLIDATKYDLEATHADRERICERLPHRGVMVQMDRIIWADEGKMLGIAERVVRPDEFWVEGHFPGNPVMPGILIVEATAQLSCWIWVGASSCDRSLGLVRVDNVVFRGTAEPGDTLILLAAGIGWTLKRMIVRAQAVKKSDLRQVIFEAKITGMPLPMNKQVTPGAVAKS